ncbi:hypothetical protein Dip510_001111 [Elusimicrobium posterum]|uniref:hypothetical protein n=1 Tax=Elusimicrobium posterum TaxID=3116653 RepID=UPI003C75F923
MKKVFISLLAACALAACASSNKNIELLGKKQVFNMTSNEVTAYYQESNQELLSNLVYTHGGTNYDSLTSIFSSMNKELEAMSRMKISKEGYYERFKGLVTKYRKQVSSTIKANENF